MEPIELETALFDLETDGFLENVTTIHLLTIEDPDSDRSWVFRKNDEEDTIDEGVAMLRRAKYRVAHNGIRFDYPVLAKLKGWVIDHTRDLDSMTYAALAWPEMARRDAERAKKLPKGSPAMPGNLVGNYSIEAFGWRMGLHKGDYRGDTRLVDQLVSEGWLREEAEKRAYTLRWASWNPDMEAYGIQDTKVLRALWKRIVDAKLAEHACRIETQVAHILFRQEQHGFYFHKDRAVALYTKLVQRKLELEAEVQKSFKPRYLPSGPNGGLVVPKVNRKWDGHEVTAGAQFTRGVLTPFNPGSRQHVARWLRLDLGWEPSEFTNDGHPKVDEAVISKLPYPQAAPLKEYFLVEKRIGQVAEGNEAWLRKVGKDGRMHGRVHPNKAVTGRMAHSGPNMGQVPAAYSPYGKECRECFGASPGYVLVGIDADALELRDLAGYMRRYDGGAYVETVLRGDKRLGTDMHSVNARALGMDPKALYNGGTTGRDIAKTWFYAFIYGAGDEKLGAIRTGKGGEAAKRVGAKLRKDFLTNLPAMGKLVEAVRKTAKDRGYLLGLDGRRLEVRSQHAALNTLLQSAGAVQMKKALCLFDDMLQEAGLIPGHHYEFVANVHDEWQLEVLDDPDQAGLADRVAALGRDAIRLAGEAFNFGCPLEGSSAVGSTWADTH